MNARAGLVLAFALAAPACYTGSAHSLPANSVSALARDPEWRIVRDVPFVAQQTDRDCGPAALAMVLAHFGAAPAATPELARGDVRAGTLRDVARGRGLEAYVVSGTLDDLFTEVARGHPWWWAWRSRWRSRAGVRWRTMRSSSASTARNVASCRSIRRWACAKIPWKGSRANGLPPSK